MSEQTYSIGPIMKAARKFKKFNQADVAQAIGCSQSALSKMEHNLLIPSAPQWFMFSRFTSIPPEALETGYIDRHLLIKVNNDEVSLGFKIPKKYRQFRAEKIRELYPFIKTHPALGKEFISHTGLEPEFFLDFDNLINYQLFIDTVQFYITHGVQKPDEIKNIVDNGQDKIYWDHYGVEWKKLKTPKEVLLEYINCQVFFQADFILKPDFTDEKLKISYIPEKHALAFGKDLSPEVSEFIKYYRKFSLEHVLKWVLGLDMTVNEIDDNSQSPLGDSFEIVA